MTAGTPVRPENKIRGAFLGPTRATRHRLTRAMPKTAKARASCCLTLSEGFEKPKTALYTCSCGSQFEGLKAWSSMHP